MSILERIRSRAGLLVGIIFVALLAFVLGDFLGGKMGLFNSQPGKQDVGRIAGHDIDMTEWTNSHNQAELDFELRSERKPNGENEQDQLNQQVWQSFLDKYILEEGEYKNLGLTLTDDELAEQMLGNHPNPVMKQVFGDGQSGQVAPQFALPNGELNMDRVREYVKSLSPDKKETQKQYYQWLMTERLIREYLFKQKYYNLIKKGLYVTSAQAKMEHKDDSTLYTVRFVAKKYSEIPDSTIKISDAEAQAYYTANQYKYKQPDNKRSMEYVAFDVFPSADDIQAAKTDMTNLATDFGKKKPGTQEDSMFVMNEMAGKYNATFMHKGQFPLGMDSVFQKAEIGKVIGPIQVGENLDIYKVLSKKTSIDSARVRHILVGLKDPQTGKDLRSDAQAKMRADSILRVIKGGKKMEDLVGKLTDDLGSKGDDKKGDYGWFTQETGFVQEFKDAGFNNKKGETVVVKTQFGYHVIQVLDQTAPSEKIQVVSIEHKIEPSPKTQNEVYNKALDFASKNNTADLFNNAIKKGNMNKLLAPDVLENSHYINGINEGTKEIARWMFNENTKVGAISEPFSVGNRYIVCNLTNIREKGFKPLEEVRTMVEVDLKKQKKADMFIADFNKAKSGNLEGYAQNLKTTVMTTTNLSFSAPNFISMGPEGEVTGHIVNMKKGVLSGPLKGNQGVYVVQIDDIKAASDLKDTKQKQMMMSSMLMYSVENTAFDILKEKAEVVDHRSKYF